jgi:hypothetical protein
MLKFVQLLSSVNSGHIFFFSLRYLVALKVSRRIEVLERKICSLENILTTTQTSYKYTNSDRVI